MLLRIKLVTRESEKKLNPMEVGRRSEKWQRFNKTKSVLGS